MSRLILAVFAKRRRVRDAARLAILVSIRKSFLLLNERVTRISIRDAVAISKRFPGGFVPERRDRDASVGSGGIGRAGTEAERQGRRTVALRGDAMAGGVPRQGNRDKPTVFRQGDRET
jgi:hypothetical protein